MTSPTVPLPEILSASPVHVVFGRGVVGRLGALAGEILAEGGASGRNVLLVTDSGIIGAGHLDRAKATLEAEGVAVHVFSDVAENPTTDDVAAGVGFAKDRDIGLIVALGGGSVMDCAKGVNLILTNGGRVQDYWGVDKTTARLLPLVAVPTTAGTGSEAQSFALITDPGTHQKMACGDRRLPAEGGLRPRVAILDPDLTESQPRRVASATGLDAISHAIESVAATVRNDTSIVFSTSAWRLLAPAFPHVVGGGLSATVDRPSDPRSDMLLGAHLAGAAIENAMLGAAHACANPLTARYNIVHGLAVSVMLPSVIRFNCAGGKNPYAAVTDDPEALAGVIESFAVAAGFPTCLADHGVEASALGELAASAAKQWTAQFNPRPAAVDELLEIYRAAYG